jgi:hypothetical protein
MRNAKHRLNIDRYSILIDLIDIKYRSILIDNQSIENHPEPIKDQGTRQGDTKLNPAKILGQTLIREVLSYSFSGSQQMLTVISSV